VKGNENSVLLFSGAAVVVMLAMVMAVTVVFAGAFTSSSSASAAGGSLNAAAVPSAMQGVVPYLIEAGQLCPAVSAPELAAQINVETGGSWNPDLVSPAGAEGLAQFMPDTWPSYARDDDGTGNVSPYNPNDAVMAMGRYDCALATATSPIAAATNTAPMDLMLAAYNAGLTAVKQANGVPSIPEMQAYVAKVEGEIGQFTLQGTGGLTEVAPESPFFGAAVVVAAEKYLGTPYSWGGGSYAGPSRGIAQGSGTVGFDCSGLVLYAVYQASGGAIELPHSSEIQATMGSAVPASAIQPGDVIAFDLSNNGDFDHIGIYVGNSQVIDAPYSGAVVRIDPLSDFAGIPWAIRSFG
jgi:cell wall-associated NlpC family hydrolase